MLERDNRFQKQLDFIREIDKEKQIFRQTYIADATRKENDAEHAWHMAIMAFLFSEYANEEIDVLRTIRMILIHDVVEIDAGDTYAYDEVGKQSQREREEKAAKRLFGMLPEDQAKDLLDLWEEFEAGETKEARFARTLDNFQPMMLNDATNGIAWEEHEVAVSKILKRNERTPRGSVELWDYAKENFIEKNVSLGHIIDDREQESGGHE
ncbi:MAG: HD domain-containing protein [Agathobacter sp.]|nr:HD domain-containing protein [Agathobacter sp.]